MFTFVALKPKLGGSLASSGVVDQRGFGAEPPLLLQQQHQLGSAQAGCDGGSFQKRH
jgi:hypothetical protein